MPMFVNNEVGDIVLRGEDKRLIVCKVNEPVELSRADIAAATATKAGALHFGRLKPPLGVPKSAEQIEYEAAEKRRALARSEREAAEAEARQLSGAVAQPPAVDVVPLQPVALDAPAQPVSEPAPAPRGGRR